MPHLVDVELADVHLNERWDGRAQRLVAHGAAAGGARGHSLRVRTGSHVQHDP